MTNFNYKIIKKPKIKSVSIIIKPDSKVEITAPKFLPLNQIEEIIYKKQSWIEKKLKLIKELNLKFPPKKYYQNETFYYLGEKVYLKIFSSNINQVIKNQDHVIIFIKATYNSQEKPLILKKLVKDWYLHQAEIFLQSRLNFWAGKQGLIYKRLSVKRLKSRWGSCSRQGNIALNWKLILMPIIVIDYIILHELNHLRHMNHKKIFWNSLEKILPDYKAAKNWLKKYGNFCDI